MYKNFGEFMKKILFFAIILFASHNYAQFKDPAFPTTNIKDGIIDYSSGSLFGFLNSENFSMRHSIGMSYASFGGQGIALGTYTNSMMYRFSEDLNVQVDASIVHSPYSTFGKEFQNDLSGIYISHAAVNYRPWKDFHITLQYNQYPGSYYYNPFSSYYNRGFFGSYSPFYDPFSLR
jgi:hypothetical protein